ncbi:MAG: RNB domain-containing ribonuclease, partial [Clostridia bacterium]|nr:RNB domain-containing ribonuclease [Clostridia bacterium]
MKKNNLLFALYTEKLFGKDLQTVCGHLTKIFDNSFSSIKGSIYALRDEGKIEIENDVVQKIAEQSLDSKIDNFSIDLKTPTLVLGKVELNRHGEYVFVSAGNKYPPIKIDNNQIAKDALNKRCCASVKGEIGKMTGKVEKVFDIVDDPISENIAIAFKYGFTKDFSEEVYKEVEKVPQFVSEQEKVGRLDLTNKYFMPWDPIGCKDKDDAIYAERTEKGYKVYVAIADVAHYVKEGSAIDKEAFKRGTSCYLGSGVYPMLPPELSNGICSLNDNVD